MKRFIISTLMVASGFQALAQLHLIDLKISVKSPKPGDHIDVTKPISVKMVFTVQYGGPINLKSIAPADTLFYGYTYNTSGNYAVWYRTGMTKLNGDTIEINTSFTYGSGEGSTLFCAQGFARNGTSFDELSPSDNLECFNVSLDPPPTNVITHASPSGTNLVTIFPNPAATRIQIGFKTNNAAPVEVRVRNMLGSLVLEGRYSLQTDKPVTSWIDISTLPPGAYMVEVYQNELRGAGNFIRY